MKLPYIAACGLLSACAALNQPPPELERIHTAAKARITYQNYAAKDYRYIAPDQTGEGNCATFAFTVMLDANRAGLDPHMHLCTLPSGVGHAYTRVGGWDSDVRYRHLIPAAQNDCKPVK